MRLLGFALIFLSSGLIAQSPTGFGRLSNPSGIPPSQAGAGFGRLIYPGTGGPPAVRRPASGAFRPVAPPNVGHRHDGAIIVPYPVFYGGYYSGYDAPPAPTQYDNGYDGGYGYGQQQQPSPVVIINQNFRPDTPQPVLHDYTDTPLPPAYGGQNQPQSQTQTQDQPPGGDSQSIIFLIAMRDHTIYPAVAYWVENATLNYITPQGVRNQVSLDLVDRDFSKQLNKERNLDFALPEK